MLFWFPTNVFAKKVVFINSFFNSKPYLCLDNPFLSAFIYRSLPTAAKQFSPVRQRLKPDNMSLLRLFHSTLDLLLPRICDSCGCRLALDEQFVCAECLLNLPREVNHDWRHNQRMAEWSGHKALLQAAAFTRYIRGGRTAHIIHNLKYNSHVELGPWMGQLAARQLRDTGLFDDVDAIVPLPLTRKRKYKRGFNQAELIANGIAQEVHLPVLTSVLRRTVDRESQTHFAYEQRIINAQGIFDIADQNQADSLCGKHVMLVDDVITTGTTMLSAIQALEQIPDIRLTAFGWAWVNHI